MKILGKVRVDSRGAPILTPAIRKRLIEHATMRCAEAATSLFSSIGGVQSGESYAFKYEFHIKPFAPPGKRRKTHDLTVDDGPDPQVFRPFSSLRGASMS